MVVGFRGVLMAGLNPDSEAGTTNSRKILIDSGSGRRRQGNFARAGGRRGAHGVTRPAALGARPVFSISWPTSEFGLIIDGIH